MDPAPAPPGRSIRLALTAAAGAAAASALLLYYGLGRPGSPDAPYGPRLAEWAAADPRALDPPRLAAVLTALAVREPRNAELLTFLGRARMAAGDVYGAAEAFQGAAALAPTDSAILNLLGQAQMASAQTTGVSPEAEATFARVLARDPKDVAARYFLAQARVARGDTAAGLAGWRALRAELAAGDPRRALLDEQIADAEGGDQSAFIQSMVDSQASKLKAAPDDPAGWARLVRSYGVLGQADKQAAALAEARRLFAGRPKDLALVEAEVR